MATMSLPEHPNLDQLRSQARDLQRAVRAGAPAAADRIARHRFAASTDFPLSAAQLVVARDYGFASWPRLRRYLDTVAEHGWTNRPAGADEPPADGFCRLACLTYTRDDGPGRWQAAARQLAERPELTADHIWAAAAAAEVSTVERLLAGDRQLARRRGGPHGWRPLAYLAYSRVDGGDAVAIARRLLEAGADPNEGYLWHGLPIPFTLLTGVFGEGEQGPTRQPRHPRSLELARLLLEAGADPNDGQALYNRMFGPDNDHLELLFSAGLGRGDGGPWRAWVGELLDDPATMVRGQLRWAVEHGHLDRVRLLLAHGVDVRTPYEDGRTAWQLARLSGATAIAELLAADGGQPSTMDPVAEFVAAALRVDRPALAQLVADHPDVVGRARAQRPGLVVWAAARGGLPAVELLVELGFDVNALGRDDVPVEQGWQTALHHAAAAGDPDLARALLAMGADPTLVDARFGATAAAWARHTGHTGLATLLGE